LNLKVLFEERNRHLAACDEGRVSGKEAERYHETGNKLNDSGEPDEGCPGL